MIAKRATREYMIAIYGAPNTGNLRTFIENYDKVAKKYNYSSRESLLTNPEE